MLFLLLNKLIYLFPIVKKIVESIRLINLAVGMGWNLTENCGKKIFLE